MMHRVWSKVEHDLFAGSRKPTRVLAGSELVGLEPDHCVAKSGEQVRHTEESECLIMPGLIQRALARDAEKKKQQGV